MLRILTYNVHSCRGGDGRLRPKRVANVINRARPDIVALQELNGLASVEYLAEQLGMRHFFAAARERVHIAFGNAIFSALPGEEIRTSALPRLSAATEARCAQWVRFSTSWGGEIDVINTHLGLSRDERALQIAALMGKHWISAPEMSPHALICGDLNARPRSFVYNRLNSQMRDAQFCVSRQYATFPAIMPIWRIDHVFVSQALDVESVVVPSHIEARLASDHRPLIVDVKPVESQYG